MSAIGIQHAISCLRGALTPQGILASSHGTENYKRVWARDAIISGIAGCLHGDEHLIEGLKLSLQTLQVNQHEIGFIPSNVDISNNHVSYGSLAGRVDASLWYLVGLCIYAKASGSSEMIKDHENSWRKVLLLHESWEFNGRDLIYTPLSGNWADEYPLHGYLLYDNALRLLGLKLLNGFVLEESIQSKIDRLEQSIRVNFLIDAPPSEKSYHPNLLAAGEKSAHAVLRAGFNPAVRYEMWDTAGHALALIAMKKDETLVRNIYNKSTSLSELFEHTVVPAFWPVIDANHPMWNDLSMNFAYRFKNEPHHFHNGGIWPVMYGLLIAALMSTNMSLDVSTFQSGMQYLMEKDTYCFSEYFDSQAFKPNGQKMLCFSAAGYLFSQTEVSNLTLLKH